MVKWGFDITLQTYSITMHSIAPRFLGLIPQCDWPIYTNYDGEFRLLRKHPMRLGYSGFLVWSKLSSFEPSLVEIEGGQGSSLVLERPYTNQSHRSSLQQMTSCFPKRHVEMLMLWSEGADLSGCSSETSKPITQPRLDWLRVSVPCEMDNRLCTDAQ